MRQFIITALLVVFCSSETVARELIRVACIGNSITYGSGVANRVRNSYPAQLQYALGSDYDVRNFGVSAKTLMSSTDNPYIETSAYSQSMDFAPDIVVIKLGTNDAKERNRSKLAENYKVQYQKLINSYSALPKKPRIILLTPVICYLTEGEFKGANAEYEKWVIPAIEQLAYENKLEVIDLYHLFSDTWSSYLMPDKLHPSSIGAGLIAERVASVIEMKPLSEVTNFGTESFNFHGYEGRRDGKNLLVSPRNAAPGKPWVLRSRFWNHQPQADIALLEKGLYIAYCDVADLYGSPKAVKRWSKFYRQMTALGLNKKVVIEAMSRGGLIAYNWAAQNPTRVAAIYADAPVMDLKSWPRVESAEDDYRKMCQVYGFKSPQELTSWNRNPIDHAAKLRNIPILHVVGDQDSIVPVADNTAIFEARMEALGSKIRVIHKPTVGHHPHSLHNPSQIVNFALEATGLAKNPCTKPIPGNEFRSSAGWVEDNDWHSISDEISQILANRKLDLLLLGNSITQGFGGSRQAVSHKPGREALDAALGSMSWEAAGISGDRTQHLLWRLENGGYAACQPRNVIITIGINNINDQSATQITDGIEAVCRRAQIEFPSSRIILFGVLPAGDPDSDRRAKVDEIHDNLNSKRFSMVEYVDPRGWFLTPTGELDMRLYSSDKLHLVKAGYEKWSEEIASLIKK